VKLPNLRRGIGANSRPGREGRYAAHANLATKLFNGGVEEGDMGPDNKFRKGNQSEHKTDVVFQVADQDTFVAHDLGYEVEQWRVVKKDRKADIYEGSRRPNKYGMWLRCDTAGTRARIQVFGRRDERG
jgi:hypothetical protein